MLRIIGYLIMIFFVCLPNYISYKYGWIVGSTLLLSLHYTFKYISKRLFEETK